jgi:hypothetical protein
MNSMIAITLSNSVSAFRSGGSSSPRPEITRFDFTGLTALDLSNGDDTAKYLTAGDTAGNNHYFWWSSVNETEPAVEGIGHNVSFNLGDSPSQLAQLLILVAENTELWTGTLSGDAAILTMAANGNVANSNAGTTPVAVTTIQEGR